MSITIKTIKAGTPSIKPVSALATARKAAQIWAYLDAPIESLSLKLVSAARAEIKTAQSLGKAPEKFSYGFAEADLPYAERAIARFSGLESGYNFGVEFDSASNIVTMTYPQGKLEEASAKKPAKK